MSSSGLLPKNRTTLEAAVLDSAAFRELDPDIIRTLYDVDECPPAFLPYLAWMLSVDFWEMAITDGQRRELIRNAITWHKKRGTPWAIKQALQALGIEQVQLNERPAGAHWAEFDVEVTIVERPLSAGLFTQLERLIGAYKAERSHLRKLNVASAVKGTVYTGAVCFSGLISTVYPYQAKELNTSPLPLRVGIGGYSYTETTVYPRTT
jgi:phage tail P2-like protein